jgi:hypothetical protein
MLRNVDAAICVSYIGYGQPQYSSLNPENQFSWFL